MFNGTVRFYFWSPTTNFVLMFGTRYKGSEDIELVGDDQYRIFGFPVAWDDEDKVWCFRTCVEVVEVRQ